MTPETYRLLLISLIELVGLLPSDIRENGVKLRVEPASALIDEAVTITASGVQHGEPVTIRATMTDSRGREWQSHAVFMGGDGGRIDLAQMAPNEGTYRGVDPMGLLWSMQLAPDIPENDREPRGFAYDLQQPLVTKFILEVEGIEVTTCELKRMMMDPGVKVLDVKEDGLIGQLYMPAGAGPHPAVLVLTGSDGGINRTDAALLASRGFAAFALAYFRAEGLPDRLVEIPLEYLKKGIDWFVRQEGVDGKRLGVIGGSKGGELGLLLGATFPEIRAVVAYVPSHVAWQGISWSGPPPDAPSWSYQGQPVPYLRGQPTPAFLGQFMGGGGQPMKLLDLYRSALDNQEVVERALIPVEKINGPVMLVSGREDALWPSTLMADKVIERLREHKHPFPRQHLAYDGAGHAIRKSFLPAAGTIATRQLMLGGSEEANAKAQADSWPKVLQFLRTSLQSKESSR